MSVTDAALREASSRNDELIDADLIRATCLVGTADELIERIRELERQGLQELMFATGIAEKWAFAETFARSVITRM